MENIIWIIIAAAVIVTLAGIMLFLGSDSLTNLSDESSDISDMDRPDDWQTSTHFSFRLDASEIQVTEPDFLEINKFIHRNTARF